MVLINEPPPASECDAANLWFWWRRGREPVSKVRGHDDSSKQHHWADYSRSRLRIILRNCASPTRFSSQRGHFETGSRDELQQPVNLTTALRGWKAIPTR